MLNHLGTHLLVRRPVSSIPSFSTSAVRTGANYLPILCFLLTYPYTLLFYLYISVLC